jgi:hypothetical protein
MAYLNRHPSANTYVCPFLRAEALDPQDRTWIGELELVLSLPNILAICNLLLFFGIRVETNIGS